MFPPSLFSRYFSPFPSFCTACSSVLTLCDFSPFFFPLLFPFPSLECYGHAVSFDNFILTGCVPTHLPNSATCGLFSQYKFVSSMSFSFFTSFFSTPVFFLFASPHFSVLSVISFLFISPYLSILSMIFKIFFFHILPLFSYFCFFSFPSFPSSLLPTSHILSPERCAHFFLLNTLCLF